MEDIQRGKFEFCGFLQNEDEHVMKNIEELNLITTNTEVKPNYSLENKETSIEVFFNDAGQVLIVGVVDNNYIYWASLTDSSDKEMNANIFDYISRGSVRKVSHLYQVIVAAGMSYEEIRRWVKICLRRKPDDPMSWLTPFEGNFCSTQIQHNGKFFARDIWMQTVRNVDFVKLVVLMKRCWITIYRFSMRMMETIFIM